MITFEVKDMTCGHCVSTITKALKGLDRDAKVEIDLSSHRVQIQPSSSNFDELRDAIQEAGYTPVPFALSASPNQPTKASGRGCCCG